MMVQEVWFITGASSGFGKDLASLILEKGHNVAITARRLDSVQDLLSKYPTTSLGLVVDVTKDEDVNKGVASTIEKWGKIDVLVNNAGFNSVFTTIESMGLKNIEEVFAVNYFGLIRVTNAILPHLRAKKTGHIINVSSIGGFKTMACSGPYGSSKHAVVGISESYQKELAHLNIRVTLICPSAFRTQFGIARTPPQEPPKEIEDYREVVEARLKWQKEFIKSAPGNPALAAKAIYNVHLDPKAPFRVFVGKAAVVGAKERGAEIIADATAFEKEGIACDDA